MFRRLTIIAPGQARQLGLVYFI